jgi:hypothetical protein
LDLGAEDKAEKIVSFGSFRVRKPAGVPSKIFDLKDGEQVNTYLDNLYSKANARVSAHTTEDVSQAAYYSMVNEIVKKYLDVDKPPYKQNNLSKIFRDFPDFKTIEDLEKNSEYILNYYNRIIIVDLKNELAVRKTSSKSARDYNNDGTPCERELSNQDVLAGQAYYNAKFDAINWTQAAFGTDVPDDWRGNAFKHAVWNAQGVRKMINAGRNQWAAYDWGKKIGTAHELDCPATPGTLNPNNASVCMDLHNNAMGRTYVKHAVRTNIWGTVRFTPSEASLREEFEVRCKDQSGTGQSIRIGSREYINSLTYNDPYAMADANYLPDEWYFPVALRWDWNQ